MDILSSVINYIWFFIKIIIFSGIAAIPFIILTYIFRDKFLKLKEHYKNDFKALFIITYLITFGISLILYFIPLIINGFHLTFGNLILFIIIHILRLIIVNILFASIALVFVFIGYFIYENWFVDSKKPIDFKDLWISTSISVIIAFLVFYTFNKLLAMLIYLLYM